MMTKSDSTETEAAKPKPVMRNNSAGTIGKTLVKKK